jgi:hypothetical protein
MRKISETILDFGRPLLDLYDQPPTIAAMKNTLTFIIAVWDAHVMATKPWGKPQYLEAMRKQCCESLIGARMMELLSHRWHEFFSNDFRVVATWDIVPDGKGGHQFQCDARWPGTPGTA